MPVRKTKITSKRRAKAGNSPIPKGPACGHMSCDSGCRVRHIGPTSYLRDHHAHISARGVHHTWMATIVTGVAIVMTGALALQGVHAGDELSARTSDQAEMNQLLEEVHFLTNHVQDLETSLNVLRKSCQVTGAVDTNL
ncbi:MAG: hypothetical protein NUV81_03820 [bacterium]|nr:hypothetical protein [bacterium]